MTDRELMQMALDELLENTTAPIEYGVANAIKALRERLSQPEYEFECPRCGHCCKQREWVGLTDEEVEGITRGSVTLLKAVLSVEAKLKEKNGG